jgi:hypothetical protein
VLLIATANASFGPTSKPALLNSMRRRTVPEVELQSRETSWSSSSSILIHNQRDLLARDQKIYGYQVTYTHVSSVLRMYAVHCRSRQLYTPTQDLRQEPLSPPQELQYIITLIDSWLVRDKAAGFRAGLTAFRNRLGWARRQRDDATAWANREAERRRTTAEGSATGSNS